MSVVKEFTCVFLQLLIFEATDVQVINFTVRFYKSNISFFYQKDGTNIAVACMNPMMQLNQGWPTGISGFPFFVKLSVVFNIQLTSLHR